MDINKLLNKLVNDIKQTSFTTNSFLTEITILTRLFFVQLSHVLCLRRLVIVILSICLCNAPLLYCTAAWFSRKYIYFWTVIRPSRLGSWNDHLFSLCRLLFPTQNATLTYYKILYEACSSDSDGFCYKDLIWSINNFFYFQTLILLP